MFNTWTMSSSHLIIQMTLTILIIHENNWSKYSQVSSIAALGLGGGFSLLLATGAVASLLCSRRCFYKSFCMIFIICSFDCYDEDDHQEEVEEGGQHGQKLSQWLLLSEVAFLSFLKVFWFVFFFFFLLRFLYSKVMCRVSVWVSHNFFIRPPPVDYYVVGVCPYLM